MENKDNIGANPDSSKKELNIGLSSKNDTPKDAQGVWQVAKTFIKNLLDIREDTDRDATIAAVRKDIPFKGHNAWILIFSIFVASIGLNVSSTAVVIGAMLISPLMGPIVGAGLAVAINDGGMMKRSLLNLFVMMVLSVLTATVYFSLSPMKEETSELLARTYPTILDVLVAIFGGLALIVAKTKSGTIASVIFGVAIATALMPPLCTVGYGIAISNWNYASGALYLFFINAVFIALSAFTVAKLLRFPLVKYANQKKRKRTTTYATIIALLVLVPSIWTFYKLLKKQVYISKAEAYITDTIRYDGAEILKRVEDPETETIDLYFIGALIPQYKISEWKSELKKVSGLEGSTLVIHQGADQSNELAERLSTELRSGILEDLYVKNQEALTSKDAQIELLESKLTELQASKIPFESVRNEAKINYDGLERFGYATLITSDFDKEPDTLTVIKVQWSRKIRNRDRIKQQEKIELWLKERFKLDTLVVEGNIR